MQIVTQKFMQEFSECLMRISFSTCAEETKSKIQIWSYWKIYEISNEREIKNLQ